MSPNKLLLAAACLLGSSSLATAFVLRARDDNGLSSGGNRGPGGGAGGGDEDEDEDEDEDDSGGGKGKKGAVCQEQRIRPPNRQPQQKKPFSPKPSTSPNSSNLACRQPHYLHYLRCATHCQLILVS